jgi:hypothetical protein
MTDLAQFGEYHRQFITKANWLLNSNKISQRERTKLFLEGLHIDFRNQVKTQLRLMDPFHSLEQPWSVTQIEEAAKFLLKGCSGQATVAFPSITQQPPQPSYPAYMPPYTHPSFPTYAPPTQPALPPFTTQVSQPIQPPQPPPGHTVPAPRETFDMTAIKQFLVSADALMNKLNTKLDQSPIPSFNQQYRPSNPQYSPQPGCRACSDPSHFIRSCPKVMDYLHQGHCIKDQTNQICLPNGVLVTPHLAPGKDILKRLDNWYQAHPANNPTTSPTIVQTNIIEAEPITSPAVLPATASTQFHATTDANNELRILDAVTVGALKRQEEICAHARTGTSKQKGNSTNAPAAPKSTTAPASPTSNSQPIPSSQPQFHYSTPIEDPAITQNVIQRSLDTPFSITLRELYSTSPDIRKFIKDQVTTRRIPMGQSTTISVEDIPEDDDPAISSFVHHRSHEHDSIVVANQIEDLRMISLELDGKVYVDAILDEGSQITAI